MFRVTFCCCGCSLRTGTLILLGIDLVIGLVLVSQVSTYPTIFGIFGLIATIAGLVGCLKRSSKLLIPYIIYKVLFIVGIILMIISFILMTDEQWVEWLNEKYPSILQTARKSGNEKQVFESFKSSTIVSTAIGGVLAIAIRLYFIIVVLSYYLELKDDE